MKWNPPPPVLEALSSLGFVKTSSQTKEELEKSYLEGERMQREDPSEYRRRTLEISRRLREAYSKAIHGVEKGRTIVE